MTGIARLCALTLTALVLLAGNHSGLAQTAGPDEAVKPNGAVTQKLALTAAQKNAIYNAIIGQRVRPAAARISVAVGAAVPPSVELAELPDPALTHGASASLLKYAMVGNDVVVIDPIEMRVVDVIHDDARP